MHTQIQICMDYEEVWTHFNSSGCFCKFEIKNLKVLLKVNSRISICYHRFFEHLKYQFWLSSFSLDEIRKTFEDKASCHTFKVSQPYRLFRRYYKWERFGCHRNWGQMVEEFHCNFYTGKINLQVFTGGRLVAFLGRFHPGKVK